MLNNIPPDTADSLRDLDRPTRRYEAEHEIDDDAGAPGKARPSGCDAADGGQGAGISSEDDVSRAVEFLTLLNASSLGTAEAREERLIGREAIERLEQAGAAAPLTAEERDFDLRVANEMEWRGHPFEAELRYRSALRSDRPAKVLTPLALILEAKGRRAHALPLYVHAAQAHEPNALFRLATISHQLGEQEWSCGFIELGTAALEPEQVETVATTLDRLHRDRAVPDLGAVVSCSVLSANSIDACYALGAVLLTSGHPDLARLTFSTALARGHSLAALSLLDLRPVRRTRRAAEARRVLRRAWNDGFGPEVNALRRRRPGLARLRKLGSALVTAGASGDGANAVQALIPAPTSGPAPMSGPMSVQQALTFTRVVTTLRGLLRVGYDAVSLELIERSNRALCAMIETDLDGQLLPDEGALIARVWRAGSDELARAKGRRGQSPPAAPIRPVDRVPAAGVAHRYGHGVSSLSSAQRRALILDLSGASRGEVGAAMGLGTGYDVRGLVNTAVTRLETDQQGEQFDRRLWGAVEECLAVVEPELAAEISRRPELESGRSRSTSSVPE